MRALWLLSFVLLSCLDTQLPPAPVEGPGTVRATLVTAIPNRQERVPAKGATVTLVGTTLRAVADDDGNVLLSGLTVRAGRLLFSFDADGDGVAEQTKVVTLESARAGFGKDVNLGLLVLGRNATLVGVVKRGDRAQLTAGHGGIAVFLPELPQLAYTGDDGSFTLGGVPEGNVVLSAFAQGYDSAATTLQVGAGREERVGQLTLVPNPGGAAVGQLSGRVLQPDGAPIAAVSVRAAARGVEQGAQTDAEGRFSFATLGVGVYSLALEKVGLTPLKVDSVLVSAARNEVGPYTMTPGGGASVALDGGPAAPPDAGSGGGAAGGSAAGGSAAGGSAAGGSAAGGSAAGGSAAGGSAAGGSAAGGSAGGGSAAGGSAGGGVVPVAVVGAPQVVTPGAQVALSGSSSTGDLPLRYTWTQLPGSPAVTLSENGGLSSHSPTFTAPASGSIVEFALVVTDRFGVASTNPAVARVACGAPPTARFGPDAGLVAGGQTVVFQSTSFDDAGLPLTRHDWVATGSVTGLITDGGPSAWVTFSPVAFMAPDELARVELRVTNAIGATSAPSALSFQVRGASPNNWSLDAGTSQSILVGPVPPTVGLEGAVAPPSAMPMASWSCLPSLPLVTTGPTSAQFIAPVIAGPSRQFACTLTALGMPPLNPTTLSGTQTVLLRDGAPAQVLSTSLRNGRVGPFGWVVRLSEPVVSGVASAGTCTGALSYPPRLEAWASAGLMAPRTALPTGQSCGPFTATLTDLATEPNSTSNAAVSEGAAFLVASEWLGPWVSSVDFVDPRPVFSTMGPLPKDEFMRWSPPTPLAPSYELLARDGTSLVRSNAITPFIADAGCGVGCLLAVQSQALAGLSAGASPPGGHRTFFAGGSLFVALETGDGGVEGDLVSRRLLDGTWAGPTRTTGSAVQVRDSWSQVRVAGGSVFVDHYDVTTGAPLPAELVASGLSEVSAASGLDGFVVLATGANRALTTFRRVSGVTWASQPAAPVTDVVRLAAAPAATFFGADLPWVVIERSTSPQLQYTRLDQAGAATTLATSGLKGWAFAVRGAMLFVAASINGDVRLLFNDVSQAALTDFNGPPRAGFMTPPPPLDLDILCEAAYPHLAFVEDALVVTWQERCAPQTRWRIAARVIR